MPRQKKDARTATFYLSIESTELLERYCKETGLTKTVAVERFIKKCVEQYDKRKEQDD